MDVKQQSENKDNVQNTIRSLQDKIQCIESMLEKGNDCLMFQYGSHSIKFNRASESTPKRIRNLIAYKAEKKVAIQEIDLSVVDESSALLEARIIERGLIKQQPKSMRGKPRAKIEIDLRNIRHYMNRKDGNNLTLCPLRKQIEDRSIVFEDDIYLFEGREDYIVRQPIAHGLFNLTNGQTANDVIDDLYKLTVYAITAKLDIPMKQVSDYYCILVIPDIFQRCQVKALIDMLIRQVGFKGIYIHLESVLASFGANISQCCVVDIGAEKINIVCVDDGIILPGTYMRKNFGSADLDTLLMREIAKRNAVDSNIQLHPYLHGDRQQMERLKEKSCQLVQKDDKLNYLYELHSVRNQKEQRFLVQHNDGLYVIPNALFEADTLNNLKRLSPYQECFDFTGRLFEMQYDPEDNLEELSGGVQLSWCWGSKEKESQFAQNQETREWLHPDFMIPVDQMICYSISQVQDSEMRQKLANNILFIGGGTHLVDLVDEIEGLLIERFQEQEINEVERVEVKAVVRDVKPVNLAWVGAAVLPRTESVNEMWMSSARWLGDFEAYKDEVEDMLNTFDGDVMALEKKIIAYGKRDKEKDRSSEFGIKHLKEKIPFIW